MNIKCVMISKEDSLYNLVEYFKSIDIDDLYYYINTQSTDIIDFFESNIYNEDDIELLNMVIDHLKIAFKKFLDLKSNIFKIDINKSLKISFISDLIYFEDIFAINDVIYINYMYIKRVFYDLEYDKYNKMDDVYIYNNNKYDKGLIKLLFQNLIFLSQNKNYNLWIDYILEKYKQIEIININKFLLNNNKIIKNPSTSITNNKIFTFKINNKYYCSLNIIVSNKSYSPYYENKIFEINKKDYSLIEIEENYNIPSNLFQEIAINIMSTIIN